MQEDYKSAFSIVTGILAKKINPERLKLTQNVMYDAILLDGNPRRTVCRLYLKNKNTYIGTISDKKVETRHPIRSLEHIMLYADELLNTVVRYENLV